MLSKFDYEPKCQGIAEIKRHWLEEQKNTTLSNWCDANAGIDTDSSKTICRSPHPSGGQHNKSWYKSEVLPNKVRNFTFN